MGRSVGAALRSTAATLILAGVAVSSLLTSAQTFLQQRPRRSSIARVYIWLLGSLADAPAGTRSSWSLPYVVVCVVVCVAGRAGRST